MSAIITLTTDFGVGSPYVAAMKGVILSINPNVTLVDISHAVEHQNVRQGSLVLEDVVDRFPSGTIHVVVVDPGVGTERKIVYARMGEQHFVAPDNGLLGRLAQRTPPSRIISLENPNFWLPQVSATFHGRDVMAPVAARLSLGLDPEQLGKRLDRLVQLPWPEVRVAGNKIEGTVQSIDSFGNLITDITADSLAKAPRGEEVTITCDEHQTQGIFQTYADQPEMTFLALIGSSGKLELSIVGESAAAMLGIRVGTPVVVAW